MGRDIDSALAQFIEDNRFTGKGPLCVALVITNHARKMGLPLDPEQLITKGERGGGQVYGLGKGAVQSILARHGIDRVLAAEGGRTSRGSLGNMRAYVTLLNQLSEQQPINLDDIEVFWVNKVHEFFAGKPFKIKLDESRSLRHAIRDVLAQAIDRQKQSPGMYYSGAVLQHLVGAKLDCALGKDLFTHNSFSTADAPSGRAGDFLLGDVAIHVTTSPSEAVISRCIQNINDGYRPILVTLQQGLTVAEVLADNKSYADRIDIFEIEQFIALNLYELGKFAAAGRRVALTDLLARYNEIVEDIETDPSLKIELRG